MFLGWLLASSVALFLFTLAASLWTIVRLPDDYFTGSVRRRLSQSWQLCPVARPITAILKNLLGIILLIAGLVMLIVPGQGLLTIVLALVWLDFPGKFRLERWLATRPAVWRSLNWLRRRAGRKPFHEPARAAIYKIADR